jgi:hypothetical protein
MCLRLGLIEGNTLFVDGTKLRANASMSNTWNQKRCEEALKEVDKRIAEIIAASEILDTDEASTSESLVKMDSELKNNRVLRSKIETIVADLKQRDRSSINTTDKDCVSTKSTHGSYAGYNAQIAVDEKHGLIASCDVTSTNNDKGQLSIQIDNANKTMGKKCKRAVADAGYSALEDLEKIDQSVEVLIPVQRNEMAQDFVFDEVSGKITCPEGHVLNLYRKDDQLKRMRYRIGSAALCQKCIRFGVCTKSKRGRKVNRSYFEKTSQRIREAFETIESKTAYKLRSQKVELPFGHIRRNLGVNSFLVRGMNGVKAEMALFSAAFNIRRMITILNGVQSFIATVRA